MEKRSVRTAARSLVRSATQGEIMRHVRGHERLLSRAQLTEHLGVSRSKVSLEVGQLVGAGLLVEDGLGVSEGGRRSSLLRIPRGAGLVAAVDLGATSADVAVTTVGGEVIGRTGEPADIREGPNRVLGRAVELLAGVLNEQGADAREVIAVGVGLPGPVEYATGRPTVPPLMPGGGSDATQEAFAGGS